MTDTLTRWPSDDAPLDVWLRPLSALCDSPRSHAWAATEYHEGRVKPPIEERKRNERWNNAQRRPKERTTPKQANPGFQTNHERRERLRGMVEQEMTIKQMAEVEGVSPKAIRTMLARMKIKATPDRRGPEPRNTEELIRLWNEGLSYGEMGKITGCQPSNLCRKMNKLGYKRR